MMDISPPPRPKPFLSRHNPRLQLAARIVAILGFVALVLMCILATSCGATQAAEDMAVLQQRMDEMEQNQDYERQIAAAQSQEVACAKAALIGLRDYLVRIAERLEKLEEESEDK